MPNHPRLVLVRIQDALTPLAQGELAWHEREAGAPAAEPGARQAGTGQGGRIASRTRQRAGPRDSAPPPHAAKADELTAEELHVARAAGAIPHGPRPAIRGLLYPRRKRRPPGTALAARQILEPLRTQVAADDVLAALVRLELAECLRLTERYRRSGGMLVGLDADGVEPGIRLPVRAAAIRLAIAQRNSLEIRRLVEEGDFVDGQASAELDLARLEAWLVMGDYDQAAADRPTA